MSSSGATAGLSTVEKENLVRFHNSIRDNIDKINAFPRLASKVAFIKGLAATHGVPITETQIRYSLGQQKAVARAIDNSPSGIRSGLYLMALLAASYCLAYVSPGAYSHALLREVAIKFLTEMLGDKKGGLLVDLSLTIMDQFFKDYSIRSISNGLAEPLEESYGGYFYLAAPVLTGLYQLSKGNITRCAQATGRAAHAAYDSACVFVKTCEEFSDVIHGQGAYYDDEISSPACSSSRP